MPRKLDQSTAPELDTTFNSSVGEIGVSDAGSVQEGQRDKAHRRREGEVVRVDNLAPPDDKKNCAENGIAEAGKVQIVPQSYYIRVLLNTRDILESSYSNQSSF